MGCSPWGGSESDTTEQLHFSLSCIREGNGNPLQCSCLENPRDGGAWWAAVYGVAQSRTRLKRLSSSSSSMARKYGEIKMNAKYFYFHFLALPIFYYCLSIFISLVGNPFSHLLMFPSHEGHSISLTPDLFLFPLSSPGR